MRMPMSANRTSWELVGRRGFRNSNGRDCGVILVMNHRGRESAPIRKLIVLAGFSGIGTVGAAMALHAAYRDLEPRTGEDYVWGALEVLYRKPPETLNRQFQGYVWRSRVGGRSPAFNPHRGPLRGRGGIRTRQA
jgi:hypothetical protein